ncbi:MAG: 5-methyltetrahydropteroyltriglutamate--homocysteine methyltransferase [Haloarculaceae archaeon]
MSRVVATTPGLYPLPDWAKDELAGLKGRQKEDLITGDEGEDLAAAYDRARAEVVERQQEAGLDRVVEGQLRWDDMLTHPLAVADAVETRGIVRYYDNNNFYREPVVTGGLSATGDVAAELDAVDVAGERLQGVLPDPYSLADLATDEHYGDEADFLAAMADFLAAEVRECPPMETLFLLAPSLVTEPPGEAGERVSEAIDTVASAADAEVVLYPYWGALTEKAHAHVLDADIDALGYDLVSEPDDNLYNVQEYGTTDDVALGLVDGQNTLVESPDTVRERIEWFEERAPNEDFGTVYAAANTELFYLPVNKFEAKLDALAEAAAAGPEVTA